MEPPTHTIDFKMPLSSELQYNMSEHVNSPASLLGDYCVYLKIYPGGKSCGRGPRKGVSAYLVFAPIYDSGDEWGVRSVRFRITLRCGDQAEIKEESYDFGFGCYIDSCGRDSCGWDGMLVPKKYVPGGFLRCRAELWCDPKALGLEPNKRRRLDYGKEMWQDMKFTDLVMCAGDDAQTELHCHRAVLAKSSEVFDRMLSTDMKEGIRHRVVIQNASTDTLRKLLEYIYTGDIAETIPLSQLGELICLGNQYGLIWLAEACALRLSNMLCPENVVNILQELRKHEAGHPHIGAILDETTSRVGKSHELMKALVSAL